MIKLKTYKRCEGCPRFEATTTSSILYSNDIPVIMDHIVTCQHEELCNHLLQFLKEGLRKRTIKEE